MDILTAIKSADISGSNAVCVSGENIRIIQQRELETLKDIKSICDQHGFDYQLAAGSALGAIRHKGFIPWDDDIDINMTRKDFDRFLPVFKQKFGHKYWVHSLVDTPGYDLLMSQVNAKDIRARELMDAGREECGLIVDIFIIENTFHNRILRGIHGIGCMLFRYILSCIRFKNNRDELRYLGRNNPNLKKYAAKRIKLGYLFSVIPITVWAHMALSWSTLCKNDESEYVFISGCEYQFFHALFKRKDLCSFIEVPFEGEQVKITSDYDHYLRLLYGDYMKIPPIEKRRKHILMELDQNALGSYAVKGKMPW